MGMSETGVVVEPGRAFQSQGFVVLLLVVGGAALAWGMYALAFASAIPTAVSMFNVALGSALVLTTMVFVLPELSAPQPIPLRTYLGKTAPISAVEEPEPEGAVEPPPEPTAPVEPPRPAPTVAVPGGLSIHSLREYLDAMAHIEAMWERHVSLVLSAPPEPSKEAHSPPSGPSRNTPNLVEAEVLAFYSAASTGVPRLPNEDAMSYVARSQTGSLSRTPSSDLDLARMASGDILEAHRTLSRSEFETLTQRVKGKLSEIGERIGIVRGATEAMDDYASRLYQFSRRSDPHSRISHPEPSLPKGSYPPIPFPPSIKPEVTVDTSGPTRNPEARVAPLSPVPGLSFPSSSGEEDTRRSLVWSLALFQGFLKSYFTSDEIDAIAHQALTSEGSTPSANPKGDEGELLVHARLLRNAILLAKRRSRTPEELAGIAAELDRFVATLVETGFK